MLIKNKVIVLTKLKYRDNDLIVKCYTSKRGVVSYLIRNVLNSKKGRVKIAYFQPLSQLQIEEQYNPNRSLQSIKDIRLEFNYDSLHTNVLKSAIAMFLAEMLSNSLKEEEQNLALYDYLKTSFLVLDQEEEFSNFHLLFLFNLTKHLGFYPDESNIHFEYFNLSNGQFELVKQNYYSVTGKNLEIIKQLLGINFDALHTIKLNSKQRQSFLNVLLLYYELHLGTFKKPKSLEVFDQVFH